MRLFVAAALLTLLFTQISFGDVASALRGVRPGPVWGALLLTGLLQAVLAWRLKRLMAVNGTALSLSRVLEVNLTARFYGLFIPGGNLAGTAIRFVRLARAQEHVAGTALALAVDRVLATLSLGAVGLAFLAAVRPSQGGAWLVALAVITFGCVALVVPAMAGVTVKGASVPQRWRDALLRRMPRVLIKVLRKAVSLARQTRRIPPGRLLEAFVWSVLMHLLGAAAYGLLAEALGVELTFSEAGWARTAMLVATLLPITFAGIGLREGAAVVALGALGVAGDVSVAFALLCFVVTVLAPGVVGGFIEAGRWLGAGASQAPAKP